MAGVLCDCCCGGCTLHIWPHRPQLCSTGQPPHPCRYDKVLPTITLCGIACNCTSHHAHKRLTCLMSILLINVTSVTHRVREHLLLRNPCRCSSSMQTMLHVMGATSNALYQHGDP